MKSGAQRVVAFIPVRGGSKSIPLKNIKMIAGKPLVQWVVEAAVNATCIDEVFVATDSDEIRAVVEGFDCPDLTVVSRSAETATDSASTESALLEFSERASFADVFLIQATSPLLRGSDLDAAWEKYQEGRYASLLSVVRQKRFFWEEREDGGVPLNYHPNSRPRRQDFAGCLVENGAFYLSSRQAVLASRCRISGRIGLYQMPPNTYVELDEPEDWAYVDHCLRTRCEKDVATRSIRLLVSDCDGVLTDGGMYYSASGEQMKLFNTVDGKGVERLRERGVEVAILTSESTEIVLRRAEKLKIAHVRLGVLDKAKELKALADELKISATEIAYIGDDVNDLPAIGLCGLTACPADAQDAVKGRVDIVLQRNGGRGALREFGEIILDMLSKEEPPAS